MSTMLTQHQHTPNHLLLDDTLYFISGAIYLKRPVLKEPEFKALLLELMQKHFQKYGWMFSHWVILDNHYHIIVQSRKGLDLPKIMRNVHSASAPVIRQETGCEKPVWWNYWDYCPRDEKDSMIRTNYLLYNPIKHGYVKDLKAYRFSSFNQDYQKRGRSQLLRQFQEYPGYKTLTLHEALEDDF